MVIWPCSVCAPPRSARHLITTAVLDMERNAPTKTPSLLGAPVKSEMTPHTSIMSAICMDPPNTATDCTCRSCAKENSTPSAKSRKMIPNCASVSTCTSSTTSPKPPGPTREPAMRYPVISGWPISVNTAAPAADATRMITRSLIRRRSCCNSIVPDLGLEMTNSLSLESTKRSTSSSASLPPSARSMSFAFDSRRSNSDSARRSASPVAFGRAPSPPPPPRSKSVSTTSCATPPPVRETRTTVSSRPAALVSLNDRPAPSPKTPLCSSSALSNSLSSAFSICAASVFSKCASDSELDAGSSSAREASRRSSPRSAVPAKSASCDNVRRWERAGRSENWNDGGRFDEGTRSEDDGVARTRRSSASNSSPATTATHAGVSSNTASRSARFRRRCPAIARDSSGEGPRAKGTGERPQRIFAQRQTPWEGPVWRVSKTSVPSHFATSLLGTSSSSSLHDDPLGSGARVARMHA